MIWFLERRDERVCYEIRRATESQGYELLVTDPDGSQRLEQFDGADQLIHRILGFQLQLLETGWRATERGHQSPSGQDGGS